MASTTTHDEIPAELTEHICALLATGQRVRKRLPGGGLVNFDRLRPFMCVYRRNPARRDSGTEVFVEGEAAFLSAPGTAPVRAGLQRLVRRIAETAAAQFDAFFIIEVWSGEDDDAPGKLPEDSPDGSRSTGTETILARPRFRIHERALELPGPAVDDFAFALRRIQVHRQPAEVEVLIQKRAHPPGSKQLISVASGREMNCFMVGLEIATVYRDFATGEVYPSVLSQLHEGVSRALKRAFFTFSLERTNTRPENYFALGRGSLPKQVLQIDARLAELSNGLDLLLQVTPVNSESEWQQFEASGGRNEPCFCYRPQRIDPLRLKREVNLVPTDRVADATLAHLLRETQDELDRMVTMLADIDTPRFLRGSQQVFGTVGTQLLTLAEEMLRVPSSKPTSSASEPVADAPALVRRARAMMKAYHEQHDGFAGSATIRDDLFSGLMVSAGQLLVGRETSVPAARVEALLAHEVGTHMVTYYNGKAQPLKLLSTGLSGYDALQEGLAVLAEFLVGGLSRGRLRMIAARVVAVEMMTRGCEFADTWRRMVEEYKLTGRSAWTITMRVYRGGGLTKDAVYLLGLVKILEYLGTGGELEPLFLGKLSIDHIPVVRELRSRGVLHPAPLKPHYLHDPQIADRLARLQRGLTVLDLFAD